MDLNTLGHTAWRSAHARGWYQPADRYTVGDGVTQRRASAVELCALIACEVSEAIEELRRNEDPQVRRGGVRTAPQGFGTELADVVIRTCELAYDCGLDLDALVMEKMAYNEARSYRHGGKSL